MHEDTIFTCSACGTELRDNDRYCGICGKSRMNARLNTMALAGLIVACVGLVFNLFGVVPVTGLVLSCIAYKQIKVTGDQGQIQAVVGIVLSVIGILMTIIGIAMLVWLSALFGSFAGWGLAY